MIHQKESFPITNLPPFQQHFLTEDMLLFDIETTGLSPSGNQIYCIGCGYLRVGDVIIELFFAENPQEEINVLTSFSQLLAKYRTVITFNGNTFDIPFVRKRAALYADSMPADCMSVLTAAFPTPAEESGLPSACSKRVIFIDLYRKAAAMKSLLRLPSYSQKSLEAFLGCNRQDLFDGSQLIEKYLEYISNPSPHLLSILLLHNFEDVKGMFDLLGLLAYQQLRDGQFQIADSFREPTSDRKNAAATSETVTNGFFYTIRIRPEFPLPKSIHMISGDSAFFLSREDCLIRFRIYNSVLKYYYRDYKNYYYLPDEDYAVHRSIGDFVDPAHRKKATAKTCYTKKACEYLSFPTNYRSGALRKEYQDKNCYLAFPAKPDELHAFLCQYFSRFL